MGEGPRALIVRLASGALILSVAGGLALQAERAQPQAPVARQAAAASHTPAAPAAASVAPPAREILDKYCVTCHNERRRTAGLLLDHADVAHVADNAEIWEKVARQLRAAAMPPPGMPRPDASTYRELASWIETTIDRATEGSPNPGRVPLHRLNRTEYVNAVRDLLALDVDGKALLPADESLQGFDNMAANLTVSPTLLERYMAAARKVSRLALGDRTIRPGSDTYELPKMSYQDDRMSEALPFGSRGGAAVSHHFQLDGAYNIKVRLTRSLYDYVRGLREPHKLEVRIDGRRVKVFVVGGVDKGRAAPLTFDNNIPGDDEWESYMHVADDGLDVTVPVLAGTHLVGVDFVEEPLEEEGVLQPPSRGFAYSMTEMWDGLPSVLSVAIAGPYDVTGSGKTASRARVFSCYPTRPAEDDACATKIFTSLARRAYRRPLTDRDVETIAGFYRAARKDAGFEAGVQAGLERILVDPDFLFRVERDPANVAPGAVYRLSDLEIASRLSFFLWSSIPDDQLLDVAVRGKLSDPAVLDAQIRRMLADSRSTALVENFASQWLHLRNIWTATPDAEEFPDFDENLRDAFQQETELFLANSLRENHSVIELLNADYTFVNERLARHYGIPNVYGSQFRRVTLTDEHRRGLLGQGSILMATSYPTRTSPVLRGQWLLDNMLGTPVPPPPPNVPPLKDTGEGGKAQSVRERLEQHRKSPVCAGCHARMDPWGFALENFDAIGRWRSTNEAGAAIDSSSTLTDGTRIEGVTGLSQILLSRREQFAQTLAEKLLTYAVGRPLEYFDRPTVRHLRLEAASSDFRWSSIIAAIASSAPFQLRRAEP